MAKNTDAIPFQLHDLHPVMVGPAMQLIAAMDAHIFTVDGKKLVMKPYEGFRTPGRQYHLLTSTKNTKARPWQSAHQYGLAVDFACRVVEKDNVLGDWVWPDNADWEYLKRAAMRVGLDVPIKWDRGHVCHPLFKKLKAFIA